MKSLILFICLFNFLSLYNCYFQSDQTFNNQQEGTNPIDTADISELAEQKLQSQVSII
jgi:hypothetical protein